jgi:putative membrane-bound dehydrogenase-like protein
MQIARFAVSTIGMGLFTLNPFPSFALDGPLTPEQAIASFKIEPGLKVELVASEPLIADPVAVCFDEKGRMYVAEDRDYPTGPGKGNPPGGMISILEDTDKDGKYDKRTTFADKLTFPNGVMCWDGGLYVTCAPDIFYFKDTDGDGKADLKKTVFSGFQHLSTTQLRASHPTLSIDNWVYVCCGLTASRVVSKECPDRPPLQINRQDFRFHPNACDYEEHSGTAQFGGTFDNFGRRFICSNRNHNQHVVMQARYLRRNPGLAFTDFVQDIPEHGGACKVYSASANITTAASHTGYITSASGVTFYNGTALPEEYFGNFLVCESAGNLIHRDVPSPKGATFTAKRAYATNEFIASPDNWFRPVNLAVGPDGGLYICDMYRKTIEHPDYLPEHMKPITDFQSGRNMGRIYRVVAAEKKPALKRLDFTKATSKQLVRELESPEGWSRFTAHRLLLEKKDPPAIPHLKILVKSGKTPEARVHALRLLEGFGALVEKQIQAGLLDNHPAVREHAIQLAETRLSESAKLADVVVALADDPDARVRFQCALTLGEIKDRKIVPALINIASRPENDRWTRAAVLSSLADHSPEFLNAVRPVAAKLARTDANALNSLLPFLSDLGRSMGAAEKASVLSTLGAMTASEAEADFPWQLALVSGFAEGMRNAQTNFSGSSSPLMAAVKLDSSLTPKRIEQMMQRAGSVTADNNQPLERRLSALGLIAQADFAASGDVLQNLIDPKQPSEIQVAAVRALGKMKDPAVGAALVKRERWNGYTQSVKDAVLAALMAQSNLLDALLAAMERGEIAPTSLNSEKRNQLMKSKDEGIAKRATALFKNVNAGDRMKVFEEFKPVLALKPNSANGQKIYANTCMSCHVYSGTGFSVGPDLTGIRNQPADVLLLHIIVPEYEMMPIYTLYNVETKDGQSFSGILAAETPSSITLKMPLGIQETIQRSNIETMSTSQLSLMPQELEKAMTKQDMADLIGYLKGE